MVIPEAAVEAARTAYLSYQRGSAMHNATDAMKAVLEAAHPALLALVREQQAKLDAVLKVTESWHAQYAAMYEESPVVDALDDAGYKLADIINGTDFAS